MTETEQQDRKSKSQLKREMHALRELGQQLLELSKNSLQKIPMADVLRDAILQAKRFKREALRRQMQYIGVLMRNEDAEAIQQALDNLLQPHRQQVSVFHEVEQWRDALLAGDGVLMEDLLHRFAHAERQHFRKLVRNARKEQQLNKPAKSARALFRYLYNLRATS
ncbi:MAG: DUF615 domain-containing protein [Gammaproteobacteria bacterium]|nr:DUF615 domain-containing protein [Gammaproteobacteria bacterium]